MALALRTESRASPTWPRFRPTAELLRVGPAPYRFIYPQFDDDCPTMNFLDLNIAERRSVLRWMSAGLWNRPWDSHLPNSDDIVKILYGLWLFPVAVQKIVLGYWNSVGCHYAGSQYATDVFVLERYNAEPIMLRAEFRLGGFTFTFAPHSWTNHFCFAERTFHGYSDFCVIMSRTVLFYHRFYVVYTCCTKSCGMCDECIKVKPILYY
jgi:hypothetical protein